MNAHISFTKSCATTASPRWFASRIWFAGSILVTALPLLFLSPAARAQYTVTDLDSNQNAIGANPADPDLINAWGITSLGAAHSG